MTIPVSEWARFLALRADLFAYIATCLKEDGHCKSYEGHFRVTWVGQTFEAALVKVETDVRAWIAGNDDSRNFIEE
jgi:hypothetical protein